MPGLRTLCGCVLILCAAAARAADWPQWGGRAARNMVSDEKGLPVSVEIGDRLPDGSGFDLAASKHVKWGARLGNSAFGNPTVAGGKVFVGTNNRYPRDPKHAGDRGVMMCFDEATGKFLWQLVASKVSRNGAFHGDLDGVGICSSPTVEDNRVYVVTGRCEVVCLDADGLANGNDGPFQDEGEYVALADRRKPGRQDPKDPASALKPQRADKPLPLGPTDADIIWRFDMMEQLDSWPHAVSNCSVLVHGDLVFVNTSNGVDTSNDAIPSPHAPVLIALDKRTGKLVAAENAGLSQHILHGNWCSPSLAEVGGRTLVLLGGPDGVCYAFDAEPAAVPGSAVKTLKLVWACDANPRSYRFQDGKPLPYDEEHGWEGPSEIIGTPVCQAGRVYVTIGRDPTHGKGEGALTCIDAAQTPDGSSTDKIWTRTGLRAIACDVTRKAIRWQYTGIVRSTATPTVAGGLVYATDFAGNVHCLDADTGKVCWVFKTRRISMGSALVADGKVYVGNQRGRLYVLEAGRELKVLAENTFHDPIDCTPVAANGVLYIATSRYLFALRQ